MNIFTNHFEYREKAIWLKSFLEELRKERVKRFVYRLENNLPIPGLKEKE